MEPTLALLIDCCRQALGRLPEGGIEQRLRQADGAALARMARRHGLDVLVWRLLREKNLVLPGTTALGMESRRQAAEAERLGAESGRLHRAFAGASLPHLFLGGPALAALAWDDPLLGRESAIDLLVAPAGIGKAGGLLSLIGYVQEEPDPSVDTADWHRRARTSRWRSDDGLILRLHGRADQRPALLAGVGATATPMLVDVGGGAALPTLPPGLQLPLLSVEGASTAWSRLGRLADFAALVQRMPASVLAATADRSARLGAERPLAAALVLSHRLFGTQIPDALWFDGAARRLVRLGEAELAEPLAPEERRLGRRRAAYARMLLVPGSRWFIGEGLRQAGIALMR